MHAQIDASAVRLLERRASAARVLGPVPGTWLPHRGVTAATVVTTN
jgi:hypothetical protein